MWSHLEYHAYLAARHRYDTWVVREDTRPCWPIALAPRDEDAARAHRDGAYAGTRFRIREQHADRLELERRIQNDRL